LNPPPANQKSPIKFEAQRGSKVWRKRARGTAAAAIGHIFPICPIRPLLAAFPSEPLVIVNFCVSRFSAFRFSANIHPENNPCAFTLEKRTNS
jgi:hypothetical protein